MEMIADKIEIGFTKDKITSNAGSIFLSKIAKYLGLPRRLRRALKLKKRKRGASEVETLLSMIYCLATGEGHLCDIDGLGADTARQGLLGLAEVPNSRRAGEYLTRFDDESVEKLRSVVGQIIRPVLKKVIAHELKTKGFVPVFIDGTAIEVSGRHFEKAGIGYNGEPQYWLHNVFVGGLWVGQKLFPGGVDVAEGWCDLLEETADLIGEVKGIVHLRADNAYYNGELVDFCIARGWDYTISVTHNLYKAPLRREAAKITREMRHPFNDPYEEISVITHWPQGWSHEQSYLMVRTWHDGDQWLMIPRQTFILTSRVDYWWDKLVRRHRGKQGQENAQKGPLIDLDLHHPPCRRFSANQAYYTLGQIAQILLVATQYFLLPIKARKHGIRPVIRRLIRTAGKLTTHSRKWTIKFALSSLRIDWIEFAAGRLDGLARAPS